MQWRAKYKLWTKELKQSFKRRTKSNRSRSNSNISTLDIFASSFTSSFNEWQCHLFSLDSYKYFFLLAQSAWHLAVDSLSRSISVVNWCHFDLLSSFLGIWMPAYITSHNNIGGSKKYFQRRVWGFPVYGKNSFGFDFPWFVFTLQSWSTFSIKRKTSINHKQNIAFQMESKLRNRSSPTGFLGQISFSNFSIHVLWYLI